MAKPKIYQFKVTLRYLEPPIWRRFQVEDEMTFEDLHYVIQIVMGWEMSHLYAFTVNQQTITDGESLAEMGEDGFEAEETELKELIKKEKTTFHYLYDFGDSWEHDLVLEKVLSPDPSLTYPVCLDGARACPPEDCGGIPGYMEILETLKKPKSKAYKELMEWLDEEFDPDEFDLEMVNEELAEGLEEWDENGGLSDMDFLQNFNFSPDMIQQMAQSLLGAIGEMPEVTITGPLFCPHCQQATEIVKAKVNPQEMDMIYRGHCAHCDTPLSLVFGK